MPAEGQVDRRHSHRHDQTRFCMVYLDSVSVVVVFVLGEWRVVWEAVGEVAREIGFVVVAHVKK